jgi:hypothetical protein
MAFRGFHGKYEITVTPPAGPAATLTLDLPGGDLPAATTVQFTAAGGIALVAHPQE